MTYTQVDDFALQCANADQYFLHVYIGFRSFYIYAYHYIHVLFTQFVSQKDQSYHRLIKSNYLSKKEKNISSF